MATGLAGAGQSVTSLAVEVVGPASVAPEAKHAAGATETDRALEDGPSPPPPPPGVARNLAPADPLRLLWPLGLAIGAARILFDVVAVAQANQPWLAAYVPDDAYYYMEIAQRLARGEGFTLDGVHATNGFHPLWEGVDGLLALVWHGDELVKASLISGFLLFAAAVLLFGLLVRRWLGPLPAAAVVVAASTQATSVVTGMETPVEVLFLALVAWFLAGYGERPGVRRAALLGVACGGLVLARVDAAVVVVLVPLAMWVLVRRGRQHDRRGPVPAELATWAVAAALVAVPWFVYSWLRFGSPLPVSGAAKLWYDDHAVASAFGSRFSFAFLRYVLHGWGGRAQALWLALVPWGGVWPRAALTAAGAAGIAAVAVGAKRMRGDRAADAPELSKARAGSAVPLALGFLALAVTVQLLTSSVVLPSFWRLGWYVTPWLVVLVTGATAAIAWLCTKAARGVGPLLVALPLALLVYWVPARTGYLRGRTTMHLARGPDGELVANAPGPMPLYLTAVWMREHLPHGTFAAYDNGYIAFHDDPAQVSNLDGLANSYAFLHLVEHSPGYDLRIYGSQHARYLVTWLLPARIPSCAIELWRSPIPLRGGGALDDGGRDYPIGVLDLGRCGLPG